MGIKGSAEDASRQLREVAEEAVWSVEERILWQGPELARTALWRAHRTIRPLQRLIQTRLAWPLADRLDDYGAAIRTAITSTAVVAALGAAIAGASVAAPDSKPAADGPDAVLAAASTDPVDTSSLAGVAPDFEQDTGAGVGGGAADAATAGSKAAPAQAAPKSPPAAAPEPAQVAWDFAQAFVRYEVGKADGQTAAIFASVAEKPLAEALADDPPRLPESAEVPRAEVLNVVLGEREGKHLEASISLLRLKAASELRLTLRETPKGWRVVEVRG